MLILLLTLLLLPEMASSPTAVAVANASDALPRADEGYCSASDMLVFESVAGRSRRRARKRW